MPFDDTIFIKKNVDVLSFFSDELLRKVTSVIERNTYKKGQTILFQGEVGQAFYIVKKGQVAVTAKPAKDKEPALLAELKAGDFFGEMSLLEPTAATATIKASLDETEILTIPHEAFQFLLKQSPLLEATLREKISTRRKQKEQSAPKAPPQANSRPRSRR